LIGWICLKLVISVLGRMAQICVAAYRDRVSKRVTEREREREREKTIKTWGDYASTIW
jgi:hypothetical protein